ncbi:phosphatidate cytidylyltransferase [Dimargaris cristalligena]|uniref:Phosphatidate cytidylyltransferase n=1 Tax=Dimargaris cristalligena TaxID=215637 RepID=A0A4P9ZTM5_9FUNG|nr:phosphatidate cytidylyltransferase [Dimargaris cristalligena]RKP36578.1 phosphatidate cytidylyltransferase [Dimargaris cristalligena]|eukprot:RKP36578.1 phosphatidate cytidylyltransferase [Dimargaris cristalligena]
MSMTRQRSRQQNKAGAPYGIDMPSPDLPEYSKVAHPLHRSSSRSKLDAAATLGPTPAAASSPRWKNWWVRTLWTLVMIGSFFAIIASGPISVILMVLGIQTWVFSELIGLASVPNRERKLPWARALNWYFLGATNYYLYGASIIRYFKRFVLMDRFLQPLATHHKFISFSMYIFGFVWFVTNLQKGFYKFQFTQFAWTHMTLLMVVFTSHCIINNIFEGLIWFFLPISFVITNDIFAYIFGFFFGRTPLIQLSPKKTWEGFLGGWISTMIFGFFASSLLSLFPYMYCPVTDISMNAFRGVQCELNPIFISQPHTLPHWLSWLLSQLFRHTVTTIHVAPLQWHVLVLACFASLIAPFGGFFASGLKRAFKIKDFGHSIPGHGGITDRMDCQFMMGAFSYLYCQTFINVQAMGVANLLEAAITNLTTAQLLELYQSLGMFLVGQGVLPESTVATASAAVGL